MPSSRGSYQSPLGAVDIDFQNRIDVPPTPATRQWQVKIWGLHGRTMRSCPLPHLKPGHLSDLDQKLSSLVMWKAQMDVSGNSSNTE